MKAVIFREHGGIDRFQYTDVPEPALGDDDVLVAVKACSINHLDVWVRQGIPAYKIPLPHITGSDVAGVVAAVGTRVTQVHAGDRVIAAPGISCFGCEWCAAGDDNLCSNFQIRGAQVDGGYAQFARARAIDCLPIPASLTFEQAAAFPLVFLTAWHMLIARCRLRAGETVLVLAGGSGIGSAAIQVAKLAGARVLATVGDDAKASPARALGAEPVINYTRDDFALAARKATGGRGVDVVFEHVGPATWDTSLKALAKGGRLVTCGSTTGPEAVCDLRYVFSRQLNILGSIMGTRADLLTVTRLLGEGRLRAVIDTVFPLRDAAAAHERLLARDHFGKFVLTP